MNLYLITALGKVGYDDHDAIIVAAPNEDVAADIASGDEYRWPGHYPGKFKIEMIGTATPQVARGCVLASFNAG